MTTRLNSTISDLTMEQIMSSRPRGMTRSEWVETLIRKGLAGTLKGPIVQPGYNSRLSNHLSTEGILQKRGAITLCSPFGFLPSADSLMRCEA